MTIPEIIEVLIIERRCVERQDTPACNRDCAKCDLVLPADRVVRAYEEAIDAIHVLEQALKNHDTFMKYAYSQGKQDALEQLPCDDTISREATLKPYEGLNDEDTISVWLIRKNIEQQPPVTSQQKSGHWIYDYTVADSHRVYHCSVCGCYLKPKHSEPLNSFKWCNSCGAKMVEPQKGEDK